MGDKPVDVSASVRLHIDESFEMESDDSADSVSESTPFRNPRGVELTRVRKQGSLATVQGSAAALQGTPEQQKATAAAAAAASDADTPSTETYTMMFRIKSNDQLFRVPPDTGGSIELGADFEPINVSVAVAGGAGRKLQTWQVVALSMFWWGFALWMYMFVVLMIPGQVRCVRVMRPGAGCVS